MIPEEVDAVVGRYLRLVDASLPGRIEGLYLVGSVALEDYQAGRSDIDFVALTQDALSQEETKELQVVHETLALDIRRPWFSGIYVTWADLARNPLELRGVPFHLEGRFGRATGAGAFEANPSVWLTLRNYPTAVRGPVAPCGRYDLAAIRRWNIDNLGSYWQGWVSRHRRLPGPGIAMLSDWAIAWCVPGVVRLHYTITTGDITSKSGACHYALATFPERWHPLIGAALRLRHGERVSPWNRLARRRAALTFMQSVIEGARELYAENL